MVKKLNTKELLAESLLELSKTTPIDKITVSAIAENCGVSRKTFYNTFLDKYDLIEWIHFSNCSQIADAYVRSSPVISCTKMYAYICQNIEFYKSLAKKRSEDIHQVLYNTPYNASKFAVIGLTQSTAYDFAKKNIRVNALCPGSTYSDMMNNAIEQNGGDVFRKELERTIPMGVLATAEDQANAVVWLCSDRARMVTGISLPVDGGYLLGK